MKQLLYLMQRGRTAAYPKIGREFLAEGEKKKKDALIEVYLKRLKSNIPGCLRCEQVILLLSLPPLVLCIYISINNRLFR